MMKTKIMIQPSKLMKTLLENLNTTKEENFWTKER